MFDPFKYSIQEIREKAASMNAKIKLPKDAKIQSTNIEDVKAEWLYTSTVNEESKKVVLYFHSGGFCLGYGNNHRSFALTLSKVCKVKVLAVDYRLAPENKYPASNDDCFKTYKWLLDQGYDPQNIIIGGDSAGAGLALMTLLSIRESNLPLPKGSFFLSLMGGDLKDFDGDSYNTREKSDPLNTKEMIKKYADWYLGSFKIESPIKQDLKGLPDMFIQVGDDEVLLSDSLLLAKNAEKDGVKVTIEVWKGMWHTFQGFSMIVPEAKKAINSLGLFIENHLNG